MATFVFTNTVTNEVRLIDADLPASMDGLLPVGSYKVRRASPEATDLLYIEARINTAPPLLSTPSLVVGQVITLTSGTWSGPVASLAKRIKVNDVIVASGTAVATYTIVSGDVNKPIVGEEQATFEGGAVSAWVPSNTLTVPGALAFLTNEQWTAREAIVPADAATPRRTIISTAIAPPATKTWFAYRGAAPSPTIPTAGVVEALTGAGPYTLLPTTVASLGSTVFVKLAYGNADKSSLVWASNEVTHPASTVPLNWGLTSGGVASLVSGPAVGEMTLRIGSLPGSGGQPITTLFLGKDEAALTDTGSLALGDRVFTYVEADPANPITRTIDIRVSNANGDGEVYRLTGKARADVAVSDAPIITLDPYDVVNDKIIIDSDQAGDFRLMLESNSTARTGAYIKANLAAASAKIGPVSVTPGLNTISGLDLTGLTAGTWYIKPAVENADGVSNAAVTPVSVDITIPPAGLSVVQSTAVNDPNFTLSKSVTLPTGITAGNMLTLELFLGTVVFYLPGSAPAGWTSVLKENGATGCVWLLSKIASGSEGGTAVTFSTTTSTLVAGIFRELDLSLNQIDAAVSTTLDPPSLTPAAGGSTSRLWFTSVAASSSNGTFATQPSGFNNLVNATSNPPGSSSGAHVKCAGADQLATLASIDPVAWSTPTTGSTRLSITWSAR
jgi:hypothetical protein